MMPVDSPASDARLGPRATRAVPVLPGSQRGRLNRSLQSPLQSPCNLPSNHHPFVIEFRVGPAAQAKSIIQVHPSRLASDPAGLSPECHRDVQLLLCCCPWLLLDSTACSYCWEAGPLPRQGGHELGEGTSDSGRGTAKAKVWSPNICSK